MSLTDTYWTERLTLFYTHYNPAKISEVAKLLEKYHGSELLLLKKLVQKYGKEPTSLPNDDDDDDEGDPLTMNIVEAISAQEEEDNVAAAIAASLQQQQQQRISPPPLLESNGVPNLITGYFVKIDEICLETGLGRRLSSTTTTMFERKLLAFDADYIHYMTRGDRDLDWGCCYRCLQMILSQTHRNDPHFSFPSIVDIQKKLVALGRMEPKKVGSNCWIEPPDCAAVLEEVYHVSTIQRTLLHNNDDDSQQQLQLGEFLNDMLEHFADEGPRTPIVCDDVTYAYVVAGVAISNDDAINSLLPDSYNTTNNNNDLISRAWILLFDPHSYEHVKMKDYVEGSASRYESRSPANKIVKGGARWVPFVSLFWNRSKWMVAMPQQQGGGSGGGGGGGGGGGAVQEETKEFKYQAPNGPIAVQPVCDCPHCNETHLSNQEEEEDLEEEQEKQKQKQEEQEQEIFQCCEDCHHEHENWICMKCQRRLCGRHVRGHMVEHSVSSGHVVALGWDDLSFWCFACDAYLDVFNIPALRSYYCKYHRLKFGEEPPGAMFQEKATAMATTTTTTLQEGMTIHMADPSLLCEEMVGESKKTT